MKLAPQPIHSNLRAKPFLQNLAASLSNFNAKMVNPRLPAAGGPTGRSRAYRPEAGTARNLPLRNSDAKRRARKYI